MARALFTHSACSRSGSESATIFQRPLWSLRDRWGAGMSVSHRFAHTRAFRGVELDTYDDHRMAMSFALAGLRIPGVAIRDPGCVAKTWPDFFADLEGW